jgi:peptidoglycan/LPS O-acetylase OafA/YrhL
MRRLAGLDGLRGCLALYVMASHVAPFAAVPGAWAWLPGLVSHGRAAVDVFFVLSGLVIVQSIEGFQGRAWAFLLARVGRIFPVYLVCLAAGVATAGFSVAPTALPWLGPAAWDIWPHPVADAWWPRLAAHLAMAHGLFPAGVLPDVWTSFLGAAWSLSTEFQFYAVVAVAALAGTGLKARRLAVGLLAAAVLGQAWQAAAPAGAQFSRAFLPLAGQYFALGIASLGVVRGAPGRFFAIVLAACVAICLPGGADKALPPLVWAVCLLAVLGRGGVVLRPLQWLLTAPAVRWLGAISYPLYLVHAPVQKLIGAWAAGWAGGDGAVFDALFLPLAVAVPIAAAAGLHRWVELPGIAWSRAWAGGPGYGAARWAASSPPYDVAAVGWAAGSPPERRMKRQ